jgi:sulfate adenylyltransferase subunit 1 (EFTu-like GTPase family)
MHTYEGPQEETTPQLSYSITVADEIDTSRGGMIVKANAACADQRMSSTP